MRKYGDDTVEAIRRLKATGLKSREIAMSVGLPTRTVEDLCRRHGIRKRIVVDGRLDLPLGIRLVEQLQAEADRRNERLFPFMRQLLLKIVRPDPARPQDNLFSAILDDGK